MKSLIMIIFLFINFGCAKDQFYFDGDKKMNLTPDKNIQRSISDTDYYVNEEGVKLGVSNQIIVQFKNLNNLEKYIVDFNLKTIKTFSDNIYVFEVENKSLTFDVANALNEKDDVLYSHPDFKQKRINR